MGKASRTKKEKKTKGIRASNETVSGRTGASTPHQAQDHLQGITSQLFQRESTHARSHKEVGAAEDRHRRTIFLVMFIIFSVSLLIYFNALFNGFVSDDMDPILNSHWLRDTNFLSVLAKIFTNDVLWFREGAAQFTTNYYRPLPPIVGLCTFFIFGLKPWAFHFVNMLFHAGNSVLVFMIASLLPRETYPPTSTPPSNLPSAISSPPFIAALLFATHPIHTEPVTWISGGASELSFTFYYLLSLWFYIRWKEGLRIGYFLSLASFFASTLCKETALTFPLTLFLYDYAFRKKEDTFPVLVKRYIPYFIVAGIYLAVRMNAVNSFTILDVYTEMYYKGLSFWQYVINVFPLFVEYLKDLFFPFNLNYFHTFRPIETLFKVKGMLSMAITLAYLFIIFLAWKRNKVMFFSLVFIILPLLPAFYIKALTGTPYAERYLYLPSFGFVLLIAASFDVLNKKMARYSIVTILIVLTVVGLYSVRTITRTPVWKDNFTLLTDTVKKSPESELIHRRLGRVFRGMNRYGEAIEQYRKAVELNHNDLMARRYLAEAYTKSGMAEQAEEQVQIANKLDPLFLLNEGVALAIKGLVKEAIENFEKVLTINPNHDSAHYNLGITFAKSGQIEKAIKHLEASVRLKPKNALYRNTLGLVYQDEGSFDKAIEQFKSAVELSPSEEAYRRNLNTAMSRPQVEGF
ncbi:MAG: tetratricopeptide repeat protein [Dissulfurispiraceae bacterium]|jgi:tetratricopeptide (TPR) repeat protein